jgi:hypothetical protein
MMAEKIHLVKRSFSVVDLKCIERVGVARLALA